MKTFLCIEDGERFLIKAKNLREAIDSASIYNASVLGEVKNEKEKVNP